MKTANMLRTLAVALTVLFTSGSLSCRKGNDNAAGNANSHGNTAVTTNTASTTNPAASQDNALKNTVQANLSKYGVTGVTVEVSNGEVTLRGNVARAKLQDAMKAANEANPTRVNNQMNIQ